jgi:hypothetical protein
MNVHIFMTNHISSFTEKDDCQVRHSLLFFETSAKGTKIIIIIMGETERRVVHPSISTHTIYPSSQTGGIILVCDKGEVR